MKFHIHSSKTNYWSDIPSQWKMKEVMEKYGVRFVQNPQWPNAVRFQEEYETIDINTVEEVAELLDVLICVRLYNHDLKPTIKV